MSRLLEQSFTQDVSSMSCQEAIWVICEESGWSWSNEVDLSGVRSWRSKPISHTGCISAAVEDMKWRNRQTDRHRGVSLHHSVSAYSQIFELVSADLEAAAVVRICFFFFFCRSFPVCLMKAVASLLADTCAVNTSLSLQCISTHSITLETHEKGKKRWIHEPMHI